MVRTVYQHPEQLEQRGLSLYFIDDDQAGERFKHGQRRREPTHVHRIFQIEVRGRLLLSDHPCHGGLAALPWTQQGNNRMDRQLTVDVGDNGGPWNKHDLIIILENPKVKFGFSRFKLPIAQLIHNVGKIEDRPVVGGHDQGHAFGADDAAQQGEQIPPGCRVEFAGRFIRQQETRT